MELKEGIASQLWHPLGGAAPGGQRNAGVMIPLQLTPRRSEVCTFGISRMHVFTFAHQREVKQTCHNGFRCTLVLCYGSAVFRVQSYEGVDCSSWPCQSHGTPRTRFVDGIMIDAKMLGEKIAALEGIITNTEQIPQG